MLPDMMNFGQLKTPALILTAGSTTKISVLQPAGARVKKLKQGIPKHYYYRAAFAVSSRQEALAVAARRSAPHKGRGWARTSNLYYCTDSRLPLGEQGDSERPAVRAGDVGWWADGTRGAHPECTGCPTENACCGFAIHPHGLTALAPHSRWDNSCGRFYSSKTSVAGVNCLLKHF